MTFLLYPLVHVLFVNKVCNTAISRKNNLSPIKDLMLLKNMRCLTIGLGAYAAYWVYNCNEITFYEDDEGLMVQQQKNINLPEDAPDSTVIRHAIKEIGSVLGQFCFLNMQYLVLSRMMNVEY